MKQCTAGSLRFAAFWLALMIGMGLTGGCKTASYSYQPHLMKQPSRAAQSASDFDVTPKTNAVRYVPMPKWNPAWWFGNVDTPDPPPWFCPGDKHRHEKWYRRNSLHNFTFYVVGVADKPFERIGRYPDRVGNPGGGWNWAVCKYKWLRLPFISYSRGRFNFYAGWRTSGNLGLKLNFERPRDKPNAQPADLKTTASSGAVVNGPKPRNEDSLTPTQ